jgi:hypothetical protein
MLSDRLENEYGRHGFAIVPGAQLEPVNRRLVVFGAASQAAKEQR